MLTMIQRVDRISAFSLSSTRAPQISIAGAGTAGRNRAAPNPRGELRVGGGRPITRTECCANDPGTGGVGQGKSRR